MRPAASSLPPRNGALLQAPSFPILTVDERRLTPALGYLFNPKWLDPCESLISILWKFEKANALPGHVVARLMGPDVDPYEGIAPQPGNVDIRRLHDTLRIPIKTLRRSLLQPSQRRRYRSVFCYCRRCMVRGYHSVLHQIEGVSVCPAHRQEMQTACARCGYEAPYLASVQLLETPYRCAYCRASYGGQGWSPIRREPMKAEHRKAMTRLYFDRYLR
jgi:hypothetical protein